MATDRMKNMFKTRVLSAVIGAAFLLGVLFVGGIYGIAFFVILAVTALYEFFNMMKKRGFNIPTLPGYFLLLLLLFAHVYPQYLLPGIFSIIIYIVIYSVLRYPRISIIEISLSLFGPSYIGFLLNFALRIMEFDQAFLVMLLVLVLTWSSDIGGYLFGRVWGKHKLVPILSPAKTWEGALGSLVLSITAALLFFQIVEMRNISYAYVLLLGIAANIMGQFGDLFMSSLKRYSGVKDSGNIIPGHGGVLDRFDSFLLVAPVVYFFHLYLF